MYPFQDLLDLTRTSDVLQWLSPVNPTSCSTNTTEPIPFQCDTLTRIVSSDSKSSSIYSKDSSSTSYSKVSTVYYKGSSSRSPRRVRWADEKKIVSVYSKDSSTTSLTRVQWVDDKQIMSVHSFHDHEVWKHIQLVRTASVQVANMRPGVSDTREVYIFL
jgi:hypothetical protein